MNIKLFLSLIFVNFIFVNSLITNKESKVNTSNVVENNEIEDVLSKPLNEISNKIKYFIEIIKLINFKEEYPHKNYQELLPELNIKEDGYADINTDAIVKLLLKVNSDNNNKVFSRTELTKKFYQNPQFNIKSIIKNLELLEKNDQELLSFELENIFTDYFYTPLPEYKFTQESILNQYKEGLTSFINTIKSRNFKKLYSKYNIEEIFPELKINEEGHPELDTNKIVKSFDITKEHYYNISPDHYFSKIVDDIINNEKFNINKIKQTIQRLNESPIKKARKRIIDLIRYNPDLEKESLDDILSVYSEGIKDFIEIVYCINFNEIYSDKPNYREKIPELNINEEGHAQIYADIVLKDFQLTKKHFGGMNADEISDEIINFKLFNLKDINDSLYQLENSNQRLLYLKLNDEILHFNHNQCDNPKLYAHEFNRLMKSFIDKIKTINFNEYYKDNKAKIILPELKINEEGYSTINTSEIIEGFNVTEEQVRDHYYNCGNYFRLINELNSEFKVSDILTVIENSGYLEEKKYGTFLHFYFNLIMLY